MARRREIRTDASDEDWRAFLREVEARCQDAEALRRDAGSASGSAAAARLDRAWLTENGDPIDPEAFFVLFTGIE